uniref:Uncharacterized protein n=1 Tax=Cannabis sativa TaxID=3483 RepID=A0A803QH03_CANSA
MIVQEERQRTLGSSETPYMVASVHLSSTNPPRAKKPHHSCSNCGKPGLLVNKFFFIHGFPHGYEDKKKQEKRKAKAYQVLTSTSTNDAFGNLASTDLSTQCQYLIYILSQQLNQTTPRVDPTMTPTASNMACNDSPLFFHYLDNR